MTLDGLKDSLRKAGCRFYGRAKQFRKLVTSRTGKVRDGSYQPVVQMPDWQLFAAITLSLIGFGFLFLDQAAGEWKSTVPSRTYAFFRLLTDVGKSEVVLVPAAIAILALGLLNWQNLRKAQQALMVRLQILGLFMFVAVAGSGLTNNLLKVIFGRARPRHFEELGPFAFDPPGLSSGFQGFPSGHSATAGALAIILILLLPRFRWIWLTIAGWIAISRVVVGAHYPSDIVAGFAYGASFTWLLALWFAKRRLYFRLDGGKIKSPEYIPIDWQSLYKSLHLMGQKAYDKADEQNHDGRQDI
ncbi:MAG: phosphatase PAP2 family protein [Cohaesibacter sp.]|jgi:undecaprenyl-diphosphatase|nr:phosphatase PAP2 family protein [Cohaesibacter sp.]